MSSNWVDNFLNAKFFTIKWFNPNYLFGWEKNFFNSSFSFISGNWNVSIFHLFLSILCVFFCIMIAYSSVRIFEVRAREHKHLHYEIAEYAHHQAEKQQQIAHTDGSSKNDRWNSVLAHLFSAHPSDWKLSIIEADSMLDGLLLQLGFEGDTLGDKLKAGGPDKFHNLASAWEVHAIRNRIAHEGLSFEISQQEAKRVIALYEQIFRPYGYI